MTLTSREREWSFRKSRTMKSAANYSRKGHLAGLLRLDKLESGLEYDPISTMAMRPAAEFWKCPRPPDWGAPHSRPARLSTAIAFWQLQASILSGDGDMMTVATTNVGHLVAASQGFMSGDGMRSNWIRPAPERTEGRKIEA